MSRFSFRVWSDKFQEYQEGDWVITLDGKLCLLSDPDFVDKEMREDLTIEFSTGLLDAGGKEIFEGDRVEIRYRDGIITEGQVVWESNYTAEFAIKRTDFKDQYNRLDTGEHMPYKIKVVGNIHKEEGK